jgi:mono/diheme cytochrome c family protein
MKEDRKMKGRAIIIAIIFSVAAGTIWLSSSEAAQSDKKSPFVAKGEKLFTRYCATCHGADGTGKGPVAAAMKTGPPDLTAIQLPGGKFPTDRIATIIDGEKAVTAHGTRQMPVWGTILRKTEGDLQKQADIYSLVKYIESIQVAAK